MYFGQTSTTPATNDRVGQVEFFTQTANDATGYINYANLNAIIEDATGGSEDGKLEFNVKSAGANLIALTLSGNNNTNINLGTGDYRLFKLQSGCSGEHSSSSTIQALDHQDRLPS